MQTHQDDANCIGIAPVRPDKKHSKHIVLEDILIKYKEDRCKMPFNQYSLQGVLLEKCASVNEENVLS